MFPSLVINLLFAVFADILILVAVIAFLGKVNIMSIRKIPILVALVGLVLFSNGVYSNENDTLVVATLDSIQISGSVAVDTTQTSKNATLDTPKSKTVVIPSKLNDTLIYFSVMPNVTYRHISQFGNIEAQRSFIEAWLLESRLDSLSQVLSNLRSEYANAQMASTQRTLADQIVPLETELLMEQPRIDSIYISAQESESEQWESLSEAKFLKLKTSTDSIINFFEQKKSVIVQPVVVAEFDSVQNDSIAIVADSLMADSTSVDEVLLKEGDQETISEEEQILYKVQIGTFYGKLPPRVSQLYNRLSILRKIDVTQNDKGADVYTIGQLQNFDDAVKLQQQIRLEGVKDAFVVAYCNGKRITLDEAKKKKR